MLLFVSCASNKISDIWVNVYDPYVDKCYGVKTVSRTERELPPEQCKRGVVIFSEDYTILKNDQYKNCLMAGDKCKQVVEVLDQAVMTADKAFYEVYGGKK